MIEDILLVWLMSVVLGLMVITFGHEDEVIDVNHILYIGRKPGEKGYKAFIRASFIVPLSGILVLTYILKHLLKQFWIWLFTTPEEHGFL